MTATALDNAYLDLLRTEVISDLTDAVQTLTNLADAPSTDEDRAEDLRVKAAAVQDVIDQHTERLVSVQTVEDVSVIVGSINVSANHAESIKERQGYLLAAQYVSRLVY